MNTKYVKVQVNKNEMYNEYQRANIGNDVYEAGAYMSGFEDSERQFKEVPDHSEEMLSLLEGIVDAQYNPETTLSEMNIRVRKAKEFLNKVKDNETVV
ncbi:hypothetical protein CMU45_02735 [Elizabethkingia anophelis]|nr:hypothetical protein [Elizabethkingia anophelis]